MSEKVKLTIEFDNPEALKHFATWLCESGEQTYWDWMEYREEDEEGDITAISFDYHNTKEVNGKEICGKFMKDNTIRCKCGRMDKGWK